MNQSIEVVVRSRKDIVRQANLVRAEEMAYHTLLLFDTHLPVDPLKLAEKIPGVKVYTYHQVAKLMGLSYAEFDRTFGIPDAFTLRIEGSSGQTYWSIAYRPRGNQSRLKFTLAHELGHIVMGHGGVRNADEKEADHFASCLLCPRVVMEDKPSSRTLGRRCYVTVAAAEQALQRKPNHIEKELAEKMEAWMMREKVCIKNE